MSIIPLLAAAGGVFLITRRDGFVTQRILTGTEAAKADRVERTLAERFDIDLISYQNALKTDKASISDEQIAAIKKAFNGGDDRERASALKMLGDQASSTEVLSNESSRKTAAALAVDFQDKFEELGKRGSKAKKLLEAVINKNAIPTTETDKRLAAYAPIEKAYVDLVVDIPEVGSIDTAPALSEASELVSFGDKQAVFAIGSKDVLITFTKKIDDKTYQGHIGKLVDPKSFSPSGRYALIYIAPKSY